jgi:hypothetical protein
MVASLALPLNKEERAIACSWMKHPRHRELDIPGRLDRPSTVLRSPEAVAISAIATTMRARYLRTSSAVGITRVPPSSGGMVGLGRVFATGFRGTDRHAERRGDAGLPGTAAPVAGQGLPATRA